MQAIIQFTDDWQSTVSLDATQETPVFIMQEVFYVKAADKTTHYFPLVNVKSIVVG